MASIRSRRNSKYWVACITLPDGKRKQFSTGLTDEREALAAAVAAERAVGKMHEKPHQLRAALERLADDYIPARDMDPAAWLLKWAASRKNECAEETWKTYNTTAKGAAAWLTEVGIKSFTELTTDRLTELRDHWRARTTAFTTNLKMKHMRIALKVAVGKKLLPENPADGVAKLTETATKRRDYRPAELTALMGVLTGEWRAAFLMGLNTGGQRLNDIAVLRLNQVDIGAAIPQVTFFAKKTKKLVSLPLLQITIDALTELPSSDDPKDFVFPKIAALAKTSRSNQFREILASVGLARPISHKNEGRRGRERETHELSFHSVRHTATSMLKAAGVTDGVVRGIVGHETVAMSKVYTHHDLETTLAALKKMPLG